MKLYVANCTDQDQHITARLPERKNPFAQIIQVGRQAIAASADLGAIDIEEIVKHLGIYGARSIADFENARERGLTIPLIWSTDKPVPMEIMQRVVEYNRGVLFTRGKKLREEAAIATSHGMRNMAPQAAENLSMVVQEENTGTITADGRAPMNEGVRMGELV